MDKAHELMDFTDYQDLFDKYDTMKRISFDYAVAEHESKIQGCPFCRYVERLLAHGIR